MTAWVLHWFTAVRARLRRRGDYLLEHIVLRHQLVILQRTGTRRPRLHPSERLFWAFLSRRWADWRRSLIIVQPATVLRWRRRGLRAGWGSGSRGRWRGGRPRIDSEIRALIVRMGRENFLWGAPRIHGELLKLGFDVSQATVSRYMRDGAIRRPRAGEPFCKTKSSGWAHFVFLTQLGYPTSLLPSSAGGSTGWAGARPSSGRPPLACTPGAGRLTLAISLIGEPFIAGASWSVRHAPFEMARIG